MPLDLVSIDAQIARLQKLRELAKDPELVKLLVQFATPSDSDSTAGSTAGEAPYTLQPTEAPIHDETVKAKRTRGALTKAVREMVDLENDWFSGYDLTDRLRLAAFPFNAQNPNISVIDILRNMVKRGLLEVKPGVGSDPNLYRTKPSPDMN